MRPRVFRGSAVEGDFRQNFRGKRETRIVMECMLVVLKRQRTEFVDGNRGCFFNVSFSGSEI